jgi:aquaporin Z
MGFGLGLIEGDDAGSMPFREEGFGETPQKGPHLTVVTKPRSPTHWPEYFIEATALGAFMISAAVFAALLYYPGSPIAARLSNAWIRRAFMGFAMGLTAVLIIYSPWGQRSGAHMNPSVTLTYFRLGKVRPRDLAGYLIAQFTGGILGLAAVTMALYGLVSDPSVNFVKTVPGRHGESFAFLGEFAISFALMLTVLHVSNHPRFSRWTGVCAGLLVWAYITFEAPLSGMSMNPARTLGSALVARDFPGLWIYFSAPPLGMFLAAEFFTRRFGLQRIVCAKLHHPHSGPCIFGCARSLGHIEPIGTP